MQGKLIALGSASELKVKAIKQAFPEAKDVIGLQFPSGVRAQPIGKEETEKGAKYRAEEAKRLRPEADCWIGIENGMWKKKGEEEKADDVADWEDGASIIILTSDGKEEAIWSDTIDIPKVFPKGPNGEWSVHKDPHDIITKGQRSRVAFLSDALQTWKTQKKTKEQNEGQRKEREREEKKKNFVGKRLSLCTMGCICNAGIKLS